MLLNVLWLMCRRELREAVKPKYAVLAQPRSRKVFRRRRQRLAPFTGTLLLVRVTKS